MKFLIVETSPLPIPICISFYCSDFTDYTPKKWKNLIQNSTLGSNNYSEGINSHCGGVITLHAVVSGSISGRVGKFNKIISPWY